MNWARIGVVTVVLSTSVACRAKDAECKALVPEISSAIENNDADAAARLVQKAKVACGAEHPSEVANLETAVSKMQKANRDAEAARLRSEPASARTDCEPGHRLNWDCPIPSGNPMPLSTFKATSVEKPTVFRAVGRLSDYYNYEYMGAQKTHYAVELRDDGSFSTGGKLHVYLSKKDPDAGALYSLLSDGEPHTLTAEIAFNKGARNNDVAKMTRFVKAGW